MDPQDQIRPQTTSWVARMPKRPPFSIAKFLATPRPPLQTKWPRTWPSAAKDSRIPKSKSSQLRFTPLSAGKIDPWIFQLLMSVQDLLAKGKNEDALVFCHDELTFASLHHNGVHDCYHRLISLFTRHDDFESATSLCNRMAEEGFIAHSKTLMVLLRRMHTHDLKHIQQIQTMLTTGALNLDILAFKTILDSMVLHNSSPEALENMLDIYSTSRGEGWIAPPSIYGTIIKAHALAGQLDRAQEWLETYRETIPHRNEQQDVSSPVMLTKEVVVDPPDAPSDRTELGLPRGNQIPPSIADPNFPYAAVLMGYVKSPVPVSQRIDWLFERMQLDKITPDISMCNMLIAAYSRWGLSHHACDLYRSMLAPGSASLPDAYTYRHLFIMLNPNRRGPREIDLPADMTARQLFKEMITLNRLRLYPRKPQPHKNLISTATFNCALRTLLAQYDYAAAWTVLSCFTRHHVSPDRDTMRNVILGVLRRMAVEVKQKSTIDDIIWVDRFLGERRSVMTRIQNKTMLADRLYDIGRDAATEMEASRYETYLKPSLQISGETEHALNFVVAILRVSLQASLGYPHPTQHQHAADKAIKKAMLLARSDMIPRGRLHRN